MGDADLDFMSCCGSKRFSQAMVLAGPFSSAEETINVARDIWFNKVDVSGWLEAFAAHPQIGDFSSLKHRDDKSAEWSKGEQSTALETAIGTTLEELSNWNEKYIQKFGFVFLICASGKNTPEILSELKKRYMNRPIVELEIAANEQMKITEQRLRKLFFSLNSGQNQPSAAEAVSIMNCPQSGCSDELRGMGSHVRKRGRPITTHVLDVGQGTPAEGVEVFLEMWKGEGGPCLPFGGNSRASRGFGFWSGQGRCVTDRDGRGGKELMKVTPHGLEPGVYRLSFNTGKYSPASFFPFVSVVFEVRDGDQIDHLHVPLLFSPFSFTTYRGS